MTFRRPIKLLFESTMAFSKYFTVLPKTGGTLKTFLTIHFFIDMSPLVYIFECSSSAVSILNFSRKILQASLLQPNRASPQSPLSFGYETFGDLTFGERTFADFWGWTFGDLTNGDQSNDIW